MSKHRPSTGKPGFGKQNAHRPGDRGRPSHAGPHGKGDGRSEGRPEGRSGSKSFAKPSGRPDGERPGKAYGKPQGKPHGKPFGKPRDHKGPGRPVKGPDRDPRPEARPRPESAPTRREVAPPRPQAPRPQPTRIEAPRIFNEAPPRPAPAEAVSRRTARVEVWIYGHHPVAAALANPDRKILRVVATTEAAAKLREESTVPPRALAQVKIVARGDIDTLVSKDAVHQGVAVLAHTLEHELLDVLERLAEMPNACIIVLDQVTDPHNVGAILRSAAAFGAAAVIAPDRHAPDETGAMAKSASGALDRLPYVKAGNLVRALEAIKEHKFWLVGLDADAPQHLDKIKLDGKIALVMGAEGEGMRRLVRETCDHVASLPSAGGMESLNVSNATAVALYEWARQVG